MRRDFRFPGFQILCLQPHRYYVNEEASCLRSRFLAGSQQDVRHGVGFSGQIFRFILILLIAPLIIILLTPVYFLVFTSVVSREIVQV